jgi:ubiquinone/menaquinone biosynthesis C-methylase UbiE
LAYRPSLRPGLLAGGAPRLWEKVVRESLPHLTAAVPPSSRVLEIGYGDGLLSCFLASELGWQITGLDIRPESRDAARAAASAYGMEERLDFRLCTPEETRSHTGPWDAVFAKTVLYTSRSLDEYAEWLAWVRSVLRPGGVFVDYETGRANGVMQLYRKLRRREYTDLCLYTVATERLYDERFEILWRRHYGGLSQLVAPLPGVFEIAELLERSVARRTADNCFVVAMVARKADG